MRSFRPLRLIPAVEHRTCSVSSLQPSRLAISALRRPCATSAGMPASTCGVRMARLDIRSFPAAKNFGHSRGQASSLDAPADKTGEKLEVPYGRSLYDECYVPAHVRSF